MAAQDHKPHARHTTVVDRRFQFQFAAQVFLLQLIVVLSFQSLLQLKFKAIGEGHQNPVADQILYDVGVASFQSMLIVGVVTGALLFLLGLWFSNKVVGPLPRLKAGLRGLGCGDFSQRLNFRPGDILEDVAGEFNLCAEALGTRYGQDDPIPSLNSMERSGSTEPLQEAAPLS